MNDRRQRSEKSAGWTTLLRAPMVLALMGLGIAFFIFLGVKALAEREPADTEPVVPVASTDGIATSSATNTLPANTSDTDALPTEPPETEEVTTAAPTEPPTTEPAGPVMMTVDDSYFYDALLIGDSRTDGLRLYSNPGDAKHYCATSLNIFRVMDSQEDAYGFKGLRNLLKGMQFGKIYIMFGINECGYPTSSFAAKYKEVVEEIREYQPDAIIYLQSICYVTQKKEQKDPVFSTANLKEKNETIRALANDVDIFYLEVNDCMNDGTDHLPSEYTGDGVHLKASYYSLWHQYLLEHAVVDANHPWQPEGEEAQGAEIEHP